ncbi:MAG: response regulator transcription factor [Actinobacteria bacterium]|nr:response regulator transcription factor [Actinomycetota bacterium]
MRIVVIEDEATIADFVERGLRAEGFVVESAADGEVGLERALASGVGLVVLDRMLPGRDGLSVLRAIRAARPGLPVLMLTARTEIADRVEGLDAGATDYLIKPFAFAELAAWVRVHLRGGAQSPRLAIGGLELDLLSREVRWDRRPVRLSATEFDLLTELRHPNVALSRERLLSEVWGYDHDPGTNVVDVYVSYLRRKLAAATGRVAPIVTVRSIGYRLVVHDE